MISTRHRCIFVHIPRTGGNSVEHALEALELRDRRGRPTLEWDSRLHRPGVRHDVKRYKSERRGHPIHSTLEEIRGLHPEARDDFFTFTFVRNPWAQVVSLYHRKREKALDGSGTRMGFEAFVRAVIEESPELPRLRPLHYLTCEDPGVQVDFVGRFEHFERDWKAVVARLAAPPRPLLRLNASREHEPYAEYYVPATRDAIGAYFEDDLRRFPYAFGDP